MLREGKNVLYHRFPLQNQYYGGRNNEVEELWTDQKNIQTTNLVEPFWLSADP